MDIDLGDATLSLNLRVHGLKRYRLALHLGVVSDTMTSEAASIALITNTNLHELKQGLARTIGQILDDIGKRVATTRSAQAMDAAELATRAAERASHVIDEVSRIDFSPRTSTYT